MDNNFVKDFDQIEADIIATLIDNTTGQVTVAEMRTIIRNLLSSIGGSIQSIMSGAAVISIRAYDETSYADEAAVITAYTATVTAPTIYVFDDVGGQGKIFVIAPSQVNPTVDPCFLIDVCPTLSSIDYTVMYSVGDNIEHRRWNGSTWQKLEVGIAFNEIMRCTIQEVALIDTIPYSTEADIIAAYSAHSVIECIAFTDVSGLPAIYEIFPRVGTVELNNVFPAGTVPERCTIFNKGLTNRGHHQWDGTAWTLIDTAPVPAGFTPDTANLTGLGGTNTGWYNLITWPAVTGPDTSAADFDIHLTNSTNDAVITFGVHAVTVRGISGNGSNNSISLTNVIEQAGANLSLTDTQFRVITTDETDVNAPIALQMNFDSGEEWSAIMISNLNINYGANTVFGAGTLHTDTANQLTLSEIETINWQERNVVEGTSGGIAASSVGSHDQAAPYIDFTQGTVDLKYADTRVLSASSHGTRLSAGEYGSWVAPTTTDWPIDATFFTNLIAEKRTDTDDTTKNPSSTITLTGIDTGGVTAATMTGFDGGHRGLRFGTAGSGGLEMTFAGCLFQRITFTGTFGVATSSGGATQDYEIVDSQGNQVADWTIPAVGNDVGTIHTFTAELTTGNGDTVYTLRKRSTGTSQAVYLFNYSMTVNVDEPALEPNVVVQQDSPLRGTLLPRILPSSSITHPQGSMALDGLAGNRPIWHDGTDWAYINTTRADFLSIDNGQFFFAESGTLNEQGWTGSQHGRLPIVENYQGFPAVVHCTISGGTITIQGPNNTQAMWDVAKANGFRVDYRMMFGATHDGQLWMDIEPNNTSWGSNGRFEASIQVNSGQLELVMINSAGNTSVPLERDVMHTISMIQNAGSDIAEMHVEGKKVGEITYGGGGTTDRGTFFYIPPGNAVNDFAIQSITTYTVPAADRDVTLDKTALTTGERYNVPNINSPMNIRIPKGLYNFGNTFTVVNGSTQIATVSGLEDDHQLVGGAAEFEVLPNKEVTFTQTSFPRGNVWAVEGGKTVINHEDVITPSTGNSLILTIDSAGSIVGRHGTYLGTDVSVARAGTGIYTITVVSALFDDTTSVLATPKHTADQQMTCNYAYTLGEVIVDVLQAGTPINDSFCVAIYW